MVMASMTSHRRCELHVFEMYQDTNVALQEPFSLVGVATRSLRNENLMAAPPSPSHVLKSGERRLLRDWIAVQKLELSDVFTPSPAIGGTLHVRLAQPMRCWLISRLRRCSQCDAFNRLRIQIDPVTLSPLQVGARYQKFARLRLGVVDTDHEADLTTGLGDVLEVPRGLRYGCGSTNRLVRSHSCPHAAPWCVSLASVFASTASGLYCNLSPRRSAPPSRRQGRYRCASASPGFRAKFLQRRARQSDWKHLPRLVSSCHALRPTVPRSAMRPPHLKWKRFVVHTNLMRFLSSNAERLSLYSHNIYTPN